MLSMSLRPVLSSPDPFFNFDTCEPIATVHYDRLCSGRSAHARLVSQDDFWPSRSVLNDFHDATISGGSVPTVCQLIALVLSSGFCIPPLISCSPAMARWLHYKQGSSNEKQKECFFFLLARLRCLFGRFIEDERGRAAFIFRTMRRMRKRNAVLCYGKYNV